MTPSGTVRDFSAPQGGVVAGRLPGRALHTGRGIGQLLDQRALADFADVNGALVPDTLLRSAPITEPGTPSWLEATPRRVTIRSGATTDVG